MKTRSILLLSLLSCLTILLFTLHSSPNHSNEPQPLKTNDSPPLIYDGSNLDEESLKIYNDALNSGLSHADAIKLSNEELYEELVTNHPEFLNALKQRYKYVPDVIEKTNPN